MPRQELDLVEPGLQVDRGPAESRPRVGHTRRLDPGGRAASDQDPAVDLDQRIGISVHPDLMPPLDRDIQPSGDRGEERLPPPRPFRAAIEIQTPHRRRGDGRVRNTPLRPRSHGEPRPRDREPRRQHHQPRQHRRERDQAGQKAGIAFATKQPPRPPTSPSGPRDCCQRERGHNEDQPRPWQVAVQRLRAPGNKRWPDVHTHRQKEKEHEEPRPDLVRMRGSRPAHHGRIFIGSRLTAGVSSVDAIPGPRRGTTGVPVSASRSSPTIHGFSTTLQSTSRDRAGSP